MTEDLKISPLGDCALTVCFGNQISPELNRKVLSLADHIGKNEFPGLIEMVPAYGSLSIFYDPIPVRRHLPQYPTAFEGLRHLIETFLPKLKRVPTSKLRRIEIPVNFKKEFAPDLEFIAALHHLSEKEVIEIFLSGEYLVYMLGFLPGFAYLGEVDGRIATPRKETPRKKVPKGSVGIAGRQTGIYPLESPGGWQIIGRTATELFRPAGKTPTLLKTGDLIKFIQL